MSLPWMPLNVAEYKKDTGHLGALLHGAYLMLIMHYWATGGLPDDEEQLARIACMTQAEWKRSRATLQAFFHDGWKHKRVDEELAHAADISSKRKAAADHRHSKRPANAPANAVQMETHSPSHLQVKEIKNWSRVGEKKNEWSPPKHGATSTKHRTVRIQRDHEEEWAAYAADFREVNGREPVPDEYGGLWFKTIGARDPPRRRVG